MLINPINPRFSCASLTVSIFKRNILQAWYHMFLATKDKKTCLCFWIAAYKVEESEEQFISMTFSWESEDSWGFWISFRKQMEYTSCCVFQSSAPVFPNLWVGMSPKVGCKVPECGLWASPLKGHACSFHCFPLYQKQYLPCHALIGIFFFPTCIDQVKCILMVTRVSFLESIGGGD